MKKFSKITSPIIDKACEALKIQIDCLRSLEKIFNDNFVKIVEILAENKGKIIVTGIGKSGYIAKKISATLSSTGSKSSFIHPTEASHGDLGIIDNDDIIIILSKSGRSHELYDIINYAKNNNIIIITITGEVNSIIAKKSDYLLLLQDIKEISSVNAPTSSSNMMLVIGDIIAICLSEKKNFTEIHYKKIHPGGQIGRDLLQVKDLMCKNLEIPVAYHHMMMDEVIIIMTSKKFGCVIILDDKNSISGIVTNIDLKKHINNDLLKKKSSQIMTKDFLNIKGDLLIKGAIKLMNKYNVSYLIVTDGKKLEGIIHIDDCLRVSGPEIEPKF